MGEPIHQSEEKQNAGLSESTGAESMGRSQQPPAFQLLSSDAAAPIQRYSDQDLLGQNDPTNHPDFVHVEDQEDRAHNLRGEVAIQWNRMQQAAANAGHNIFIVSSTRNFNDQARIWNNKWNGRQTSERPDGSRVDHSRESDERQRADDILDYSSMPGTSRHHWGTDLDINSTSPQDWEAPDGPYADVYTWLTANAATYGFSQTYDALAGSPGAPASATRTSGYSEEKWHWSYIPIANEMQQAYVDQIDYGDITGFDGSDQARGLDVINNYVNSIAPTADPSVTSFGRPSVQGRVRVTASTLSIREDPSVSSSRLGNVTNGTEHDIYDQHSEGANNWVLIREGWIAKVYNGETMLANIPVAPTSTTTGAAGPPTEGSTETSQ